MASSALPPAFPPVQVDGELYWDGGIVSNSPLTYVMDEAYRTDALIFQIDLFSGVGAPPQNLARRLGRAPSSISRERRRAPSPGAYDANLAHQQSYARRIAPRRTPKRHVDGALFQVVRHYLKELWSCSPATPWKRCGKNTSFAPR